MKRKRILILFVTLVLCILVLSVMLVPSRQSSVVSAASDKPKGKITKVFRKDKEYKKSDVLPDWVDKAFKKSKVHLDTGGKGWGRGVLEPDKELDVFNTEEYDTGETLVRMDQWFNDVPVFGGQINTRLDANSELLEYGGRAFVEARHVDTKPKLSANSALKAAKSDLNYSGQFANDPEATLMILPNYMIDPKGPTGATLVYQIELAIMDGTNATADHIYFLNANDGSVVWHYDNLPRAAIIGNAVGKSQYSGQVAFQTIYEGGVYRMQDPVRGADSNDPNQHGDFTADFRGNISGTDLDFLETDLDNTWGDFAIFAPGGTEANRQTAAVDAHFGMIKTLDYFSNVHQRNGIDGGNLQIDCVVHYGNSQNRSLPFNGSFWDTQSARAAVFGDGNLQVNTDGGRGPLTALDVVGHEITHGVTQKSFNPVNQGESGAANESFSDIFGTAVECYVRGEANCNYLMGEDVSLANPRVGSRNLADPPAYTYCFDPDGDGICNSINHYPDHLDKEAPFFPQNASYDGGVHKNSTIQSKAFYLLAEGGTHPYSGIQVTGIGRAAARDIFFRALTGVNLGRDSRLFYNVRQATLAVACADAQHGGYGSASQQCISTGRAWDAVGVPANSIDPARSFVWQQYKDFLNREPDLSGWDFWTNNIMSCTTQSCIDAQRVNTSAAFFLSIEFQQTGYLVERMYKAAYGDASGTSIIGGAHTLSVPVVRFSEFLPDTQQIGQGVVVGQSGWETVLENNKQSFANQFVQRSRFTSAFPTSLTPAQFVDTLNTNSGGVLSTSERDGLVNDLTSGAKTRAQVLRAVAEDQDLQSAEFNRAFVLTQYFGYLRRNPNDPQDMDYSGYDFWLQKLIQFNGNYEAAEMVKAFITSTEYRSRFGPA